MLGAVLKDIWTIARARSRTAGAPRATVATRMQLAPGWRIFGSSSDLQHPFDVAVITPTVGRPSLRDAVQSVYDQAFVGRIQLLIGVDAPLAPFDEHEKHFTLAPSNVTVCLYYPGYSTSVRHRGLHPARDGGVLRAVLTYMANARYVAYLDDDNWWSPVHLQSLLTAVQGRDWAYSYRWFVDQETRKVACADDGESVGPGRGIFVERFGGWVDPNCVMFDKLACEPAIRLWTVPLPGDARAMSADRQVFDYLQKQRAGTATGLTTTYYSMQVDDGMHPYRLRMVETPPVASGATAHVQTPEKAHIRFSFLLPTRKRITGLTALMESIKATTARSEELEIILGIDEDDQESRDFVCEGLNIVKTIVPNGLTMGRLNQACYKASRGQYVMAMNDDVLVRTPRWDERVTRALEAVRDDIFLGHVNDLLFGQTLCCFPIVSRTFCELAGGFCPEQYERYRIDDHIHEAFVLLGGLGHSRVLYLPNVIFEHLNYVPGNKGQRLYQLNQEILARDAARYEELRSTRRALAEKLARHISAERDRRIREGEARIRGAAPHA